MTRLVRFSNNAVSRLAANITNAATTISLTPGDGAKFPVISGTQFFMATLIKSTGETEIVKVTARATDTLTVVRAAEPVGATQVAYAFSAGDRIEQRLTAKALSDELDRLDSGANIGATNKTANYTVQAADVSTLIRVDTTAGAITITLPEIASLADDFDIMVAKVTDNANAVNIVRAGSTDLINGATSYPVNNQWQSAWLIADRSTNTWTAINSGAATSSIAVDTFTGDGTAGPYTLSGDPVSKANTAVYLSGVYQQKATYTLAGTSLTMGGNVPVGVTVEVVWSRPLSIGRTGSDLVTYDGGTVQDVLDAVTGPSGAASVGYTPEGTGAVSTTVEAKLQETASVFDYLTPEQIASVKSYSYSINLTLAIQIAINESFAANKNLFAPAGGYLVDGLYLPGRVFGGVDDRGKAFRLYGQGTGEAFVTSTSRGTVFKSVTDAPVLQDYLDTDPSSNGSVEIDHIRFDGNSTSPVIKLQSFFGVAHMHDCVVYQRGTGDGIYCSSGATGTIERTYSVNRDWATFGLGASRVGVGFNIVTSYNQGLLKISKCTSRGWSVGYAIGGSGGANSPISYFMDHCEGSVVRDGVVLAQNANKAVVSNCYIEGGDGGTGITNEGNYSSIRDNLIFPGFSTGIKDISITNKGTLIDGNIVNTGTVTPATGIAVGSSATYGGWNKNVTNNSVISSPGVANVAGIELNGTTPRINITGNSFDPRGNWSGAGSAKIKDLSTGGSFGLLTRQVGEWEIPYLSGGAISLFRSDASLTEANVSANKLTLPSGSYFPVSATAATVVQSFSAGETPGRIVILRTINANMTIQNTALIKLAGGVAFTGPGTITFFFDIVGSNTYAYEICRAVF